MFYESLLEKLRSLYPETSRSVELRERLSENLFCAEVIPLSQDIRTQAQDIVRAFWSLRNEPSWKARLESKSPEFQDPGNSSVLMSYDFHIDEAQNLRLIEVNTNASMSLLADALYKHHGIPNSFTTNFREEIFETFRAEFAFAFPDGRHAERAVIIDQAPEKQRLYAEFRLFQELFSERGLETQIADVTDLRFESGRLLHRGSRVDLVYNRHTDFYLTSTETSALRAAVDSQAACISPHPHEYRLLADKERLLELSQPETLSSLQLSPSERDIIRRSLIRTVDIKDFTDPDGLWAERKNWFFKTKQSYGGKAAYRGSSISRSAFAHVISGPYLAQEMVPAPSVRIPVAGGEDDFKFDLRFFAYRDTIQLACARLYKGQLTNSQTPGGGIAPIVWR